uniref:NAD-dependent epimerase/dehydratase domain-containing protein n=1 Tax=Panagrolaimus sp. ES5 TaxID=591445 RepID=A0AC34F2P5_9BILA
MAPPFSKQSIVSETSSMSSSTSSSGNSSFIHDEPIVLVTGASGYVALHCVDQLLKAGYRTRGTVRSLRNAEKIEPLRRLPNQHLLELVEADLERPEEWPSIVDGCTYILHVASPWPIVADEKTISIAVNGTMTVLRAASKCSSVKKVVLTSSCAAINDGHKNNERIFDETCWTKLDSKKVENYAKSKTIAEKTAWDYWNSLNPMTKFELTVLNPTFITGPVLSTVEHGSATIIGRMMDFRTFLAAPKACLGVVDVRDVAKAHILAMTNEKTNGERILITHTQPTWFRDMRDWLMEEFKEDGYIFSPITVPNWLLKIYAKTNIDPQSSAVVHRIGPELRFSNQKSLDLLRMTYISPKQSVIEMMHSMIELGMVRKPPLGKCKKSNKNKNCADSEYSTATTSQSSHNRTIAA